jgi:ubiquitin C-terminal hydrolase
MGSSENGHYYSFIKEGDCWFEFNDCQVRQVCEYTVMSDAEGSEPVIVGVD